MRLSLLSLFSLLSPLSPNAARAQGQRFIFERIKQLAVIPEVFSMDTDEHGRLWYSTWGRGVFCFDGYNHTRYMTDGNNPNSISNDRVFDLEVDRQNRVWIGTLGGLSCLDRKTGQVRRFSNVFDSIFQFQAVFEDRIGRIWVGTANELLYFDENSQQLVAVPRKGDSSKGRCHKFYEDADGTLWLSRSDGLFRFASDRSSYEKIPLQTPEGAPASVNTMLGHSTGSTLLGGNQGLFYFNQGLNQLTRVLLPDSMAYRRVLTMLETPDGALWVSLRGYGLLRWDIRGNQVQLFKNNPLDPASLTNNVINSLKTDQFGNLWVGAYQEVLRLNLTTQPFSLWPINPGDPNSRQNLTVRLAEDTRGGILVRTVEALYYLEYLGAKAEPILINGKNIIPDDFCTGADGTVWAVNGVVYQWDVATRSFSQVSTPLKPGDIYCMEEDKGDPNVWWLGSPRGLERFDRRSGTIQSFHGLIPRKYDQYVRNMCDDGRGSIWLDLPLFLGKFDKKAQNIRLFSSDSLAPHHLINNEILDIQAAPNGWVWVSTSGGVSTIDPVSGHFHNYTQENGLGDNIFPTVLFDRGMNAWIVAPEQIMRRDVATGAFRAFNIADALQTYVWTRGRCQLRDGRLLFASGRGVLLLDPDKVVDYQAVSSILLTRFETSNKEGSRKWIPEFLEQVQLPYQENDLTLEWAGIQTALSKDLQYECKLERQGEEEAWKQKGNTLQAVYSNLEPGAYTFRVRVVGADKPELVLRIVIAAPWWQSSWFKMLLLAMALTLGYLLWLNRERQRQLRQQKELAEQNARYKTRFLANMSHEIRTPMNAILGLSRLLTESDMPPKQSEYAEAIRQSSENLLVIVNDVLDQAKIESGKFRFQHKPFDLNVVLRHLENTLAFKAAEKGVRFSIEIAPETPTLLLGDPVRLSQILTNLLGNAIKFTEKGEVGMMVDGLRLTAYGGRTTGDGGRQTGDGGRQTVDGLRGTGDGGRSVDEGGGAGANGQASGVNGQQSTVNGHSVDLRFVIRDTGIGIAEDQLEKVFESFQQADEGISSTYGGTGLGLSITKELVEQQGGHIVLESTPGAGTTVTVTLPFTESETMTMESEKVAAAQHDLKDLHILLVEDTFFNQMLAIELLKSRIPGVEIAVAENGQVALEKLAVDGPFDLVLMDVKMPVMDGLEATRRLRAQPQWANLPVIALTANAVPEELEKCRIAGMNAWVTKPIDTEDLLLTLHRVLQNR